MDNEDEEYRDLLAQWGLPGSAPVQESMRGRRRTRAPSTDDKKVRRQNGRRTAAETLTAGGEVQKRADLVRALPKAASLAEQARLLDEISKIDQAKTASVSQSRELDFASAVVRETFAPVRVHEHHTAATDWIGYEEQVPADWQHRVVAEAATWFGRVPDFVKADGEEFAIQAQGKAQQFAGQFGIQATAARQTFEQYAAFLRTQAASGLDQIQQVTAPDGVTQTSTPLPTEVFDNFAPEVDPINAGVSGTEDSNRAPLIQEIVGGGSGMDNGAPEKPSEHDESGQLSWNPPQGMQGTASLISAPTVAIGGYGYSMDDFRREAAAKKDGPGKAEGGNAACCDKCGSCGKGKCCSGCGDCTKCPGFKTGAKEAAWGRNRRDEPPQVQQAPVGDGPMTNDRARFILDSSDREDAEDKILDHDLHGCPSGCEGAPHHGVGHLLNRGTEWQGTHIAASGLDQIQQTVDPNNVPKPTPIPPEVAFPLDPEFQGEQSTGGTGDAQPTRAASRKQADMWGNSDTPHAVVQPNVANSPATTPPNADQAGGRGAGAADARAHERPAFSDESAAIPAPAEQYAEGYASVDQKANLPQDVPGGGVTHAGTKVSSLIVTAKERLDPDFRKGYGYASRWTSGTRLVSTGSSAFEAGVYAGISDNPTQQRAFVTAHRTAAAKYPALGQRVDSHRRVTVRIATKNEVPTNGLYVQSSTSIDLNTMAPNTTPAADGSTPINGPGRPGPLDGLQEAAAPGGPAPYNGVEPFGTPVVPNGAQDPSAGPADHLVGGGGMATTQQLQSAFRRKIQSSLLAERKQGK